MARVRGEFGRRTNCEAMAASLPGAKAARHMPFWYGTELREATQRAIASRRFAGIST